MLPSHVLPSPCLCHRGQKTAARLSSSNEDLGDPCEDALAFSQGGPSHKIAALCFDDRHAQTSRSTPNLTVFAKLPYVPSMNCQRCENGHTARRGAVNRAWSIAATRLQSRAIDERAGPVFLCGVHICARKAAPSTSSSARPPALCAARARAVSSPQASHVASRDQYPRPHREATRRQRTSRITGSREVSSS